MARKILIDCDPGIDDAVALCMALFDPRVEVVGITATAGNVDGHQATSNVMTILDQLDPAKWPKIGGAVVSDAVPVADARHIERKYLSCFVGRTRRNTCSPARDRLRARAKVGE